MKHTTVEQKLRAIEAERAQEMARICNGYTTAELRAMPDQALKKTIQICETVETYFGGSVLSLQEQHIVKLIRAALGRVGAE